MSVPIETKRRYTVSEYLRLEDAAAEKHEYRDGEIIGMAGGTYYHGVITVNVQGEIRSGLKGRPCRVSNGDVRVRIPRTPLFTYPDASVVCGAPEFDPSDPSNGTITNPRLIVEVLSPSTEAYDRGEKFRRYRELESLCEYVLIRQDVAEVEVFYRQDDGTWLFAAAAGLDARLRLRSIDVELSLAEVYAQVEFPPQQDTPSATQA